MEASKGFRARLYVTDAHSNLLQCWAANNLALSSIFCSGRSTILVGLSDRARTAASFARTLRTALKRMALPTNKRTLQGHWVTLLSVQEAVALCVGQADLPAPAAPPAGAPEASNDERIVTFPR